VDINRNSVNPRDFADLVPWPDGGAEGVRTPDLLNAIQALYQLSYDPSQIKKCRMAGKIVKNKNQCSANERELKKKTKQKET
jgi:hypothetical protein